MNDSQTDRLERMTTKILKGFKDTIKCRGQFASVWQSVAFGGMNCWRSSALPKQKKRTGIRETNWSTALELEEDPGREWLRGGTPVGVPCLKFLKWMLAYQQNSITQTTQNINNKLRLGWCETSRKTKKGNRKFGVSQGLRRDVAGPFFPKNGSRYTGVSLLHSHRSRYTVPLRQRLTKWIHGFLALKEINAKSSPCLRGPTVKLLVSTLVSAFGDPLLGPGKNQ